MPDRHARRDTNQSAFDKEYFDMIEEAFSYTRVDLAIDLAYSSARERWIYGIFLWPKLGPRAVAIV